MFAEMDEYSAKDQAVATSMASARPSNLRFWPGRGSSFKARPMPSVTKDAACRTVEEFREHRLIEGFVPIRKESPFGQDEEHDLHLTT
jgi:hypothetical protein